MTSEVSADNAAKLKALATEHGVTGFMLMHAVFSLLLSRHGNSKDIVIGTPTANRLQQEIGQHQRRTIEFVIKENKLKIFRVH